MTLTPGLSIGTSSMLCCKWRLADVSVLPIKMQSLHLGSKAPVMVKWYSIKGFFWWSVGCHWSVGSHSLMLYSWSVGHHSLLLLVCKPSQFTAFLLVCRPTELSVLLLVCKPQVAVQLVHCYWSVGHSLVYCYCRLSQCSELPQTCKSSKFSLSSFHPVQKFSLY